MRRFGASISIVLLLSCAPLVGCGSDQADRGLAPADESAAPNSVAEDSKTEAQRQEEVIQADQARENEEFDAANGPKPDAKPAP